MWAFLRPYVEPADAYVFSRAAFAWDGLDRGRIVVIAPTVDVFPPKNEDLSRETAGCPRARAVAANRRPWLHIAMLGPPWIPVPPPGYGGIEFVLALVCDALVDHGHEVELFCAPGPGSAACSTGPTPSTSSGR